MFIHAYTIYSATDSLNNVPNLPVKSAIELKYDW